MWVAHFAYALNCLLLCHSTSFSLPLCLPRTLCLSPFRTSACVFGRLLSCTFSSLTFRSIVLLDFLSVGSVWFLRSSFCFFFFFFAWSFPFRYDLFCISCVLYSRHRMLASSEPKPLTATVHTQQPTTKYLSVYSQRIVHIAHRFQSDRLLSCARIICLLKQTIKRNSTICHIQFEESSETLLILWLAFFLSKCRKFRHEISLIVIWLCEQARK